MRTLIARPVSAEGFLSFGEIIYRNPAQRISINNARFERYANLATLDLYADEGSPNLSIFRCQVASEFPLSLGMLERHPLGSQAFYPLSPIPFVVVVAPVGEVIDVNQIQAFVTDGTQGINLHRGVWHAPLLGAQVGQEFLVIDRGGANNCDEYTLPEPLRLELP